MKCGAWQPCAAYLYVLSLDGPSLGWEYLRRNPAYRRHWSLARSEAVASASRWGLLALEDPTLNAEEAHPLWWPLPTSVVELQRAAVERCGAYRLGVWQMPGRKSLVHAGDRLHVRIALPRERYRLNVPVDWIDGGPVAYALAADADMVQRWAAIRRVNALLGAPRTSLRPAHADTPDRTAITHMRALQALDGCIAGASHRDIALCLFGAKRVASAWSSDGELRAQTRYCIRRARQWMDSGYRRLVWPSGGEDCVGASNLRSRPGPLPRHSP